MKIRLTALLSVLVLLLCGAACSLMPPTASFTTSNLTFTGSSVLSGAPLATYLADFAEVVARVRPSVVAIETDVAAGTGWIIDASGIVVTNTHVIDGGTSVTVIMDDGRSFPAQSVQADTMSDLAIVRIRAGGLAPLSLGRSADLRVGQPVAAIGNSLGEGIAMTGGWVSRLGVTATVQGLTLTDLIQTDTAINEGNSGGPLVNLAGQIVGITTAKLVETGVEGVGYVISIDSALPLLQQLINTGSITRPYLGVGGLADSGRGVSIGAVAAGAPAAQAGLREGDIIIAVDDAPTLTVEELRAAILTKQVGQRIKITYLRGTAQADAFATLAKMPSSLTP